MKTAVLSPRLRSAANFVRQNAVLADVGTDHAYLPLFLLECGRVSRAVASDINEGPLASARSNAAERGLSSKIEFVLTDGARALSGRGITDMAICGMGGELIAEIVKSADFLRSDNVRLILQPMTRAAHLRRELCRMGYRIKEEAYTSEPHHNYVTILAEYSRDVCEISDFEAEFGIAPYMPLTSERRAYIKDRLEAMENAARGKSRGGQSAEYELSLIERAGSVFNLK